MVGRARKNPRDTSGERVGYGDELALFHHSSPCIALFSDPSIFFSVGTAV